MRAGTMAKKKPPGPKPSEEPRDSLVAVRCRPTWKDWLERMAKSERSTPTQVIDRALADFAAKIRFEEPPER